MRYSLLSGKFGMYFYDTELHKDLTLKEILQKLNDYDNLINRLIGAMRTEGIPIEYLKTKEEVMER